MFRGQLPDSAAPDGSIVKPKSAVRAGSRHRRRGRRHRTATCRRRATRPATCCSTGTTSVSPSFPMMAIRRSVSSVIVNVCEMLLAMPPSVCAARRHDERSAPRERHVPGRIDRAARIRSGPDVAHAAVPDRVDHRVARADDAGAAVQLLQRFAPAAQPPAPAARRRKGARPAVPCRSLTWTLAPPGTGAAPPPGSGRRSRRARSRTRVARTG